MPASAPADVDSAVAAAGAALVDPAWAGISQAERADLVDRFAPMPSTSVRPSGRTS